MSIKRIYAAIKKVEAESDGTIKVYGYASSGATDSDGETITPEAMKAALPDYMKWGAVREMHQPKAAGTAIEARVEDDGRTWFGAHIVDSEAVKKVQAGVYKGFSVGGSVTARDELVKTTIKGIKLVEVSLVDRPANPEATIALWKVEDAPAPAAEAAVDALAELLNKGAISPARLVELAQGEIAKASDAPETEAKASEEPAASPVASEPAPVNKGMYGVARFAELLSSVADCASSAKYEADLEGDQSPIPGQLRDWLSAGAGIFSAMAVEEATELVAAVKGMAEKLADGGDVKKAAAPDPLDTLRELLAKSEATITERDALAKISKAVGAAGATEGEPIDEFVTKLASERDTLKKRVAELEAMPAPGKALLKALDKAQDVIPSLGKAEDTLPENATPDQRAMFEIKKALRAPMPVTQFL